MRTVEKVGKTTDEAIEAALKELEAHRDEVEVEIIDYPSRGLFGIFGNKAARVKVTLLQNQVTEKKQLETEKTNQVDAQIDDPVDVAMEFLETVFSKMGVKVKTDISRDDGFIYLSFTGEDLGILIGRRGETLDSLQYLLNLIVSRKMGQRNRIILDVEGYRKRREETLVKLAQRLSEKVKRTGHNIVLEPMSPHERRIIHTALQNDQRVRTFSEGEEPYRKVVITRKR
ncbi:MAG: protein jag [Desulfitobacteriaceae bacterium]|nr:protein jag [Desulfitobacteriaceae bacterium]MDD4751880.1 protein jag [Desulfitobacteriaceae bacterium]